MMSEFLTLLLKQIVIGFITMLLFNDFCMKVIRILSSLNFLISKGENQLILRKIMKENLNKVLFFYIFVIKFLYK